SEIASASPAIAFTAEIPNLSLRRSRLRGDSEITFVLRFLGGPDDEVTEPEEIFRDTGELDSEIGTFTLFIPQPEKGAGFRLGEFELVTSLEAKDSLPIRKVFTIKE
ncbi:MAG: hypothetical protein AAGF75_04710, partial [Cyanobacteria bacterium P01_H01_bin.130]